MAVAVGLDHRHHRRARPGQLAQQAHVGADRAEVDDDLGACVAHVARFSQVADGRVRTATGIARATSVAVIGPPREARVGRGTVQPGSDRGRVERIEPGGEQCPDHSRQHVTRTGSRQPRHPGRGDPDPAVGRGDQAAPPLEYDGRTKTCRGDPGVLELPGLDLAALDVEHPGQFAGVRRQDRRDVQRPGEVLEGVGVDDERDPVRQAGSEGVLGILAASGADHPGLHPPRSGDHLGMLLPDRGPRPAPTYRTMPASPQAAPATLRRPAPGYCAEPARTPTTPRVYFCASGSGRGTSAATSAAWRAVTSAAGRPRPMSTRVTEPQARLAGSTRWATLWVPKVTVTAASTWGPSRRPSSTDTPLGTSTATIGDARDLGECGDRLRLQPRASADPDDPVDHHLGRAAPGRRHCRRPVEAPPDRPDGPRRAAPHRRGSRDGPAGPRRTARPRRCHRIRPAVAPGARTPTRAGR